MKKFFYFAVVLIAMISLMGCETVKGVGRDIEGASSTVQRSFSK